MIKSETSEVSDDEILIRRVKYANKFNNGLKVGAFSPVPDDGVNNCPDKDGISLFRRACLDDLSDVLQHFDEDQKLCYGLVGVTVREVKSISGLDVEVKPMDLNDPRRIKGHVVIPQMNCYQDLQKLSDFKRDLTKYAAVESRIYRRPSK